MPNIAQTVINTTHLFSLKVGSYQHSAVLSSPKHFLSQKKNVIYAHKKTLSMFTSVRGIWWAPWWDHTLRGENN